MMYVIEMAILNKIIFLNIGLALLCLQTYNEPTKLLKELN